MKKQKSKWEYTLREIEKKLENNFDYQVQKNIDEFKEIERISSSVEKI